MNFALYAIAAVIAVGALLSICMIGKPRKPITPGSAAVIVVINAAEVVVLILAARQLR
jgi:hypothetical protein